MIRYSLRCRDQHVFESWFQSAAAFEALQASGHLTCPECGSGEITKAPMAPNVKTSRAAGEDDTRGQLSKPADAREAALAELRRKIEESSDYVGLNFASEARAMHEGDMPSRSIYGEAKPEEARALIEDGVPVAPLPFRPRSKVN